MTLIDALHHDFQSAGWMAAAACRGADPNMFFVERGESDSPAKAVCHRCPVSEPCLAYALKNRIPFGLWGGMSERARKRMRRQLPLFDRSVDPATLPHGTLPRYRRGGCRCSGCRAANTAASGRRAAS